MVNLLDEIVSRHARTKPNAPAVRLPDRVISYGELEAQIARTAQALRDRGIDRTARVVLTAQDEYSGLLLSLACAGLGATFTWMRSAFPVTLRESIAREVAATVQISDAEQGLIPSLPLLVLNPALISDKEGQAPSLDWVRSLDEPALTISVGSGSTGRPKKIQVSHKQELELLRTRTLAFNLTSSDVVSHLSALEFVSARRHGFSALYAGGSIRLLRRLNSNPTDNLLGSDITVLGTSVIGLRAMLNSMGAQPGLPSAYFPDSLRVLSCGGSVVDQALRAETRRRLTDRLHITYGTNELGLVSVATPSEIAATPGTVGHAVIDMQIQVVDADGRIQLAGTVGRLRLRGHHMINGYLDDQENTLRHFSDGWFYPGDLGRLTEDGQIVFCGRADDMMTFNGINIFPAEIENVVGNFPGVLEAVAFPLPHRVHQDVPVCAVTLASDAPTDEMALLKAAQARLGTSAPHRIFVFDEIRRNDVGKIDRQSLRQEAEARLIRDRSLSAVDIQHNSAGPLVEQAGPNQPALSLQLTFHSPKNYTIPYLDEWIDLLSATPPDIDNWLAPLEFGADASKPLAWLHRVLRVVHVAFLVGRLPVFDSPRILQCKAVSKPGSDTNAEAWSAQIAIALVAEVSPSRYQAVLSAAFAFCKWIANQKPGLEASRIVFQRFQAEVLKPLAGLAGSGKSTIAVLRVAHQRGIPFAHLGGGSYQLGWGSKGIWLDRSTVEGDSAIGAKVTQDKQLTAALLRRAGLPAPEHIVVASPGQATQASAKLGWPLVVKPADRERGEGVTVDVTNTESLAAAFQKAYDVSVRKRVLVERQVEGVCHRLFLADGRLLYAVKRWPMSVYGDGKHSIAHLVEQALIEDSRLPPWYRSGICSLDAMATTALAAAGLAHDSIPAVGVRVALRRIETTEFGGVDEEVSSSVHPENLRVALEAARLLHLDVAGVDIISPDISSPWYANGAIINEVNFAPMLGGAEISRRYVGDFLSRFIETDGRIPIEVFVGDTSAWTAAKARQAELIASGVRAWLTNGASTLAPGHESAVGVEPGQSTQGVFFPLKTRGVCESTHALIMRGNVDSLLLVLHNDELLLKGLPLDRVDSVHPINSALMSAAGDKTTPLAPARTAALMRLVQGWCRRY